MWDVPGGCGSWGADLALPTRWVRRQLPGGLSSARMSPHWWAGHNLGSPDAADNATSAPSTLRREWSALTWLTRDGATAAGSTSRRTPWRPETLNPESQPGADRGAAGSRACASRWSPSSPRRMLESGAVRAPDSSTDGESRRSDNLVPRWRSLGWRWCPRRWTQLVVAAPRMRGVAVAAGRDHQRVLQDRAHPPPRPLAHRRTGRTRSHLLRSPPSPASR